MKVSHVGGEERGGENYWYGYCEFCMDKGMCKSRTCRMTLLLRLANGSQRKKEWEVHVECTSGLCVSMCLSRVLGL